MSVGTVFIEYLYTMSLSTTDEKCTQYGDRNTACNPSLQDKNF